MTKKNIIFLVIDSLRYDRIGVNGNSPSPTPTLDRLLLSSVNFKNFYSVGCPTEFAYPGLTSSTLPLDKGGYSNGIIDREITFSEVLKNNGYHTGIFFEDHFRSSAGYKRGYDDIFYLFDFSRFLDDVKDTVPHYKNLYNSGERPIEYCISKLEDYISILFIDMIDYCLFMEEKKGNKLYHNSLLLHTYNFKELRSLLIKENDLFLSNKKNYILCLFDSNKLTVFDEIRSIVYHRNKRIKFLNFKKGARFLLFRLNMVHLFNFFLKRSHFLPSIRKIINEIFYGYKISKFVSAAYIVNTFSKWIDNMKRDKPFLAWIHTADIHELNFLSNDILQNDSLIKGELKEITEHYNQIRKNKKFKGNALYDLSIKYTDIQLKRLMGILKERNLYDNTIIVLIADHGHLSLEWPKRESVHIARDFFEELYHIPFTILNANLRPSNMNGLYSSLDVVPTLLNLLELPISEHFKGKVINFDLDEGREYVIMEHLGPGPGDFSFKPIRICIRTKEYKLVYLLMPNSEEGEVIELYRIDDDKYELNNLNFSIYQSSPEINNLMDIAKNRAFEIRSENLKIYS
jgi:arylsulfatase A-like enzyme